MGRPPKPFSVLTSEGKSHRTKAELELRKKGEEELLTGYSLKESKRVREDENAHKMFSKLNKLLKEIGKNDALFESIINRYCILYAECEEFEEKREKYYTTYLDFENKRDDIIVSEEMTVSEYYKTLNSFMNQILSLDKQIQAKRKMMLDIEKENLMTIQAGLRSIPKKEDKGGEDPLLKILNGG